MTITMNIAEAKAKLSELLDAAASGEHVVIARAGKPVATLTPIAPPPPRELGFLPIELDDGFFAPLDENELTAWE
jgi:prevent-host-death family protein